MQYFYRLVSKEARTRLLEQNCSERVNSHFLVENFPFLEILFSFLKRQDYNLSQTMPV
jgi:hypothetical protein